MNKPNSHILQNNTICIHRGDRKPSHIVPHYNKHNRPYNHLEIKTLHSLTSFAQCISITIKHMVESHDLSFDHLRSKITQQFI